MERDCFDAVWDTTEFPDYFNNSMLENANKVSHDQRFETTSKFSEIARDDCLILSSIRVGPEPLIHAASSLPSPRVLDTSQLPYYQQNNLSKERLNETVNSLGGYQVNPYVQLPPIPRFPVGPYMDAPVWMQATSASQEKKKRSQVKSACSIANINIANCRKISKKCSDSRPCERCILRGLEHCCQDAPPKKRSKKSEFRDSLCVANRAVAVTAPLTEIPSEFVIETTYERQKGDTGMVSPSDDVVPHENFQKLTLGPLNDGTKLDHLVRLQRESLNLPNLLVKVPPNERNNEFSRTRRRSFSAADSETLEKIRKLLTKT
jgi:hypothetical protein